MYALSASAEGDCYRCVPPDPGIAAAALGARESVLPRTVPAEALHTFTLDSGASRCFFHDSTTLTPLPAPVPVRLADPCGGLVVARSSTVLLCPAVPSGLLSGLHLPLFSTNLVSTAALQDAMVITTILGDQRVSIYMCTRTGRHLATLTCRPGSSLYTLATEPPQVAASTQVSASGQVAPPCSCCLLSHQTLLWHHRLCHPSLPCLRGMQTFLLVLGVPRSLPPLPPSPAPPFLRYIKGRQRATLHSSSFPLMIAPLQTLNLDVWGPARVSGQGRERYFLLVVDDYKRYTTVFPLRSKGRVVDVLILSIHTVRLQLRERFSTDLPVLRLHSDRGGEFSSDLLRDLCRGEGILQSFTLPASPQRNGIAEHRIGLVMELNLWPRLSLPETSPTLRWTRQVGNASVFRVWGSRAFVCDTSADKLFARAIPCGPAPSSVSQVDPLPGTVLVVVAGDSGAARGDSSRGAEPGGAEPGGAESEGARSRGAKPGGAETWGAEHAGVEPGGAEPEGVEPGGDESKGAESGGDESKGAESGGAEPRGAASSGGAGVTTGAGGTGGTAATGPRGARTRGTGAAGTCGVGDAGAGDPTEPVAARAGGSSTGGARAGGARAGGTGAGGAGAGGAGVRGTCAGGAGAAGAGAVGPADTVQPRSYFVPLLQQVIGVPSSTSLTPPLQCPPPHQLQLPLQPASPRPAPSPYIEHSSDLTERCEPASRPVSPVRTACHVPRSRPPPVPGTHTMALCPSSVQLRVPLPAPPESSLTAALALSLTTLVLSVPVSLVFSTAVIDPSFETAASSALVAELLDFAVAYRLDYTTALIAESESASPPSVGGECALGTDVLEDKQEDFECLAAAVPRFVSMLLAPEGDLDAPDIPTPRSHAEAIMGPYSSQWHTAMDAEMASWKSTGTYVDEVPPPWANIVDGMWILRVKRPTGSPPAFKMRYVAQGFSQRQGVDYIQTFSPTPKMTILWIWLRRPPGVTGLFPADTQWSLRRPFYSLRQAPREWHDTLRTTLAALGFAPSTADPSLFLRTDTSLPPFYVLVYVDNLVFATAYTEAPTLVKSEL
ncbi:unnamed protein product [Closterium sp. NIES-54]